MHFHLTGWEIVVKHFHPTTNVASTDSDLKPLFAWRAALYYLHIARLQDHDDALTGYSSQCSADEPFPAEVIKHGGMLPNEQGCAAGPS